MQEKEISTAEEVGLFLDGFSERNHLAVLLVRKIGPRREHVAGSRALKGEAHWHIDIDERFALVLEANEITDHLAWKLTDLAQALRKRLHETGI